MDDDQDYYECCFTPNRSTEENKSGVTLKGKDKEYIAAHGKIVELFKKKGEKFFLNGIELSILDKQKNKPINIELKSKISLRLFTNLSEMFNMDIIFKLIFSK